MSAYTVLTAETVQAWLELYGFCYRNHTAVSAGIENTTYFVNADTSTGTHEFVLTVFEQLVAEEVTALSMLLDHLKAQGLAVACPVRQLDYSLVGTLADKPAWLCPKLGGSHPLQPTVGQCFAVGQALARMHHAINMPVVHASVVSLLAPARLQRSDNPYAWLKPALTNISSFDPVTEQPVLRQLADIELHLGIESDRVLGLVHADLFRDNVLCIADTVTGLLDFSEVCYTDLVYDLAITLNDFASDSNGVLIPERVSQLLQGYQQVRPLRMSELSNLPRHLAMAAARFWLSRLHAAQQLPASNGQLISLKDPTEMLTMLHDRLSMLN